MRANLSEITIGEFLFVIEMDTGGDGTEYICWIYNKDGSPYCKKDGSTQVRKYLSNTSKTYINNFCKKFISNEAYRESYR